MWISVVFFIFRVMVNQLIEKISDPIDAERGKNVKIFRNKWDVVFVYIPILVGNAWVEEVRNATEYGTIEDKA